MRSSAPVRLVAGTWLGGLLLLSLPAHAATGARLAACARIGDDTTRLACYDALAGRTLTAAPASASPAAPVAAGTAAVPTPAPAPRDPVAAFGDRGQLPAAQAARLQQPRRVNFHLSKVEPLPGGLFRLTMDNGQVWATRESDWALDFSVGDEVTIQRMVAGGFRISHPGQGRNVSIARVL